MLLTKIPISSIDKLNILQKFEYLLANISTTLKELIKSNYYGMTL